MEKLKTFAIFKNSNKKEGSTQPDYKLSAKIGEEYIEIGGGWVKDGQKGKFISVKLSDAWADHTKGIARKGFSLVADIPTEAIANTYPEVKEDTSQDIPF